MSSYGSVIMGLLGMNICSSLKDIKKFKQKYISYSPINNSKDINFYYEWKNILFKHYIKQ